MVLRFDLKNKRTSSTKMSNYTYLRTIHCQILTSKLRISVTVTKIKIIYLGNPVSDIINPFTIIESEVEAMFSNSMSTNKQVMTCFDHEIVR